MLKLEGVSAGYGAIEVLKKIDLEVRAGEIVTLIGANGAGKTTTLMTICGFVKPRTGRVTFEGRDLATVPAHEIVRLGLVQCPEGRKIFPRLTVLENLEMGAFTREDQLRRSPDGKGLGGAALRHKLRTDLERDLAEVFELFPILADRRGQAGGTLSGGEQQMLAVGRAMMTKPKLLLLDEPSLGLAPLIVKRIFDVIETLNREGVTVLLVEQNARMALKLAHRGYVMETGEVTMTDEASVLLADARVRDAYLGE
ncbi:MAG: ABC transporter ATP-binding protein [Myxococcales bacterium]|nr:ABC transporter ATP-binding protein [Myxococcales bacterium]